MGVSPGSDSSSAGDAAPVAVSPGSTDAIFAALGDSTRRGLMERLSSDGPLSATDLAAGGPISRQAVVKHLTALSGAGLLRAERRGREVLYHVDPARLDPVTQWMERIGHLWDQRLVSLVKHVSDPRP